MRPAVVLLGFVLGSSAAISFSLLAVAIVVVWLQPDYPRLDGELRPVLANLGIFAALTAIAGLSFYGEVKGTGWRRYSQLGLAVALIAVVFVYWP
jgi:hypothetical protein